MFVFFRGFANLPVHNNSFW